MRGVKSWRGAAIFLLLGVVLFSVVLAQDSFFDVFFDIDLIDDLESECRRDCRNPRAAISACNDDYRNSRNACDDVRDEMYEECNELVGRERLECRRAANNVRVECRGEAQEVKVMCLRDIRNNKELCELQCKINICESLQTDSDGDDVIDLVDNCVDDFNPNQEDRDGNGVGDVCEEGIFCCLSGLMGGECFQAESIEGCRIDGGAVMNCLPDEVEGDVPVSVLGNYTSVPVNANDVNITDLIRNVTETGINNTRYVNGSYECADFSGDLEGNLTARGYNATFTAFWCYGGAGNPAPTAHAVVDVHLDDGRTVWIEPQTGRIINMDMDGDGNVEVNNGAYTPGRNMGQTDDNCKISVFESRAAANAAGVPGA
jgi:hypothetical protein